MKIIKITAKGIIIEITNSIHGCLEQGGISGRQLLLYWARMQSFGIKQGMSMEQIEAVLSEEANDYGTNGWDCLELEISGGGYDKTIRKGHRIQ